MDEVVSQPEQPQAEAGKDSSQPATQQQTVETTPHPQQPIPETPLKKPRIFTIVILILFLITLGVSGYWFLNKEKSTLRPPIDPLDYPPLPGDPHYISPTSTLASPSSTTTSSADLKSIPSLYQNLSWQTVPATASGFFVGESGVLTVNKGGKYFDIALKGEEWTSEIKDMENRQQVFDLISDFSSYYTSQLTALGWSWRITIKGYNITPLVADGPTGGTQGYIGHSNGMTRTILWRDNTHYKKGKFPTNPSCPCDTSFWVFVSEITPLSEILPELHLYK